MEKGSHAADEFWDRFGSERLEAITAELERQAREGGFNIFAAKHAAATAVLSRRPDIAQRIQDLLNALPDEAYLTGAIMNFEPTAEQTARLRPISTFAQADRDYPQFSLPEFRRQLKSDKPHLALYEAGRLDEAWRAAQSELDKEEVGCASAVLGDFKTALKLADSLELPDYRRSNIRMVVGIEYARRRLRESFLAHLDVPSRGSEVGEVGLYYILALAGRQPWLGYPFPDW